MRMEFKNNFISAISEERLEKVRKLIQVCDLDFMPEWSEGYSLLRDAIKYVRSDKAKLLLSINAKVNKGNSFYTSCKTPLHYAARNGDYDVVEMLLTRRADVDAQDDYKWTPLHWAVQCRHIPVVKQLLSAGADVTRTCWGRCYTDNCKGEYTALHIAAENGVIDIVKLLLNALSDLNARATNGETPLLVAVQNGHENAVSILLEHGADANARTMHGTVLHYAAEMENSRIAEQLLKFGARVNFSSSYYWKGSLSPFHFVFRKELYNSDDLFQNESFSHEEGIKKGFMPLHVATLCGRRYTTKVLLDHGADIDARSADNDTPLYIASTFGHDLIVEDLLVRGCNINDAYNRLALYSAVHGDRKRHMKVVDVLLKHGLSVCVNDRYNYKLLRASVVNGYSKIVQDLIQYGTH